MINQNFLITDKNGSVLQQLNYNLWGKRSMEAGSVYASPLFDRGFTGHEHIDVFGIINMNGRLYDPVVGRFLSPDNYVQGEGSQTLNRYSYCLNNPLKYTDPDGELIFLIPAAIGAIVGYYLSSSMFMQNFDIFSRSWWQGQKEGAWKAGVAGAIVGAGVAIGLSSAFGPQLGVTGMSASAYGSGGGFAVSGATTPLWNITSNALISGTINTLSTGLQTDWDVDAMYKSGLVGVGAGAIGGIIASSSRISNFSPYRAMSEQGIRNQNYVTNILSGAGDRLVRSIDADLSAEDVIKNTFWGGVEGAFAASMFSSDKMLNFGKELNRMNNPVFGRYFSSFLSNSMTSNPGISLNFMFKSKIPSIDLSKIQTSLVGPNYPYVYGFKP